MAIDYSCAVCDPTGIATWMPVLIVLGAIPLIFLLIKIWISKHG